MDTAASPIPRGADRTLLILDALARADAPLSLAQLLQATAMPRSTLYRQLARLRQWGFVAEHDGSYTPGPVCAQLGLRFDQGSHLVRESQAEMAALARSTGESVGLLTVVRDQAVCLDMVDSTQPLRCSFVKGRCVALGRGASTKALLAFMPERQRQALLGGMRLGLADRRLLEHQLETVRAAGFAVSEGEVDAGVWGVSAPVFLDRAALAGTITLMAPLTRGGPRAADLIQSTLQTAHRVSERLRRF